jgi:hypothetical protein
MSELRRVDGNVAGVQELLREARQSSVCRAVRPKREARQSSMCRAVPTEFGNRTSFGTFLGRSGAGPVVRILLLSVAMRRPRLCLATLTLVAIFGTLGGCGKETLDNGDGKLCRSNTDCGSDEVCEPITAGKLDAKIVAPCPLNYVGCSNSSGCPAGQVCWPASRVSPLSAFPNCFPPPQVCAPACPSTPCFPEEVCEPSGECRLTTCDEQGAVACPAHWQCDSAAAANEPNALVYGAAEPDSSNYTRDIARGCARLRCDEPGGFTCRQNWTCAPLSATDPSGCAPLKCEELGHCSDDEHFICTPTSSRQRPDGMDVHGCVRRNCEEGEQCEFLVNAVNVGYCDFDGPLANSLGCAARPCDVSDGTCRADQRCDPESKIADPRGCRSTNCEEGRTCPASFACDLDATDADSQGCVFQGTGGSSAGGGGGRGGNGGAATGGSAGSSAGSTVQGGSSTGAAGSGGRGGSTESGGASGSAGSTAPGGDLDDEQTGRCAPR